MRVGTEGRADGVALAVADDGPGVPPEQRSQVTERGVSLAGGTGLGLAIVVDIAEAHGWELSVEESESGGARFLIVGIEPADE